MDQFLKYKKLYWILVSIVILGFTLRVAYKVYIGEGLDTYHSVSLVRWNYVSALAFVVSAPVLIGVFYCFFKLGERRQKKRMERVREEIKQGIKGD
ncbi:hypothetical protein [Marinimicrobium sp. LS-A18]|uniref:hypothetical protein n=1 Tax=Marinimicrobium sp. LS-A18 TaxID=1381596 RepID=UPI0004678B02|nr:hypothetical protein [Marinimicrobium sp. LS-A18]